MARESHRSEKSIMVSLLTIKLILPACASLKDKRSTLQPLISRIRKEFNVSISEIGLQDVWHSAWIGCVLISNDANHNSQVLNNVVQFIESHFHELQISEHHIENH
ncbi:MAG: hypothetical protein FD147_72 [Chloroflexi bacterium]|nr:MAG: hypothetical protein FD147_72 [Chloroflexota bacterium]MBA4374699.1 DUF503 domain-containing protein [Anaerolinea sp.]